MALLDLDTANSRRHHIVAKINQHGFGSVTLDGNSLALRSILIDAGVGKMTRVLLELTLCDVDVELDGDVNLVDLTGDD